MPTSSETNPPQQLHLHKENIRVAIVAIHLRAMDGHQLVESSFSHPMEVAHTARRNVLMIRSPGSGSEKIYKLMFCLYSFVSS